METNSRIDTFLMVDTIIVCGGEGTRIKHLSKGVPKCVMDINGRPFLLFLCQQLQLSRITNHILLSVSDKKAKIVKNLHKSWADKPDKLPVPAMIYGIPIQFVEEPKPTGTLMGLLIARPYLTTENVLIMNGDTYCKNFDFQKFLEYHVQNANDLTVAKHETKNTGIWLIKKSFLDNVIIEHAEGYTREALMLQSGYRIGYWQTNYFIDIGTPEGLTEMRRTYK